MTLVDRSDDLTRLVEEGYDIEIRDGNLVVHHVPYVTSAGEVDRCILVSELSHNGERTVQPGRHEIWVVGGVPYDHQGSKVSIVINEDQTDVGAGLRSSAQMSGKPGGQPPSNYYDKISRYVLVLSGFARAIEPGVTHTDYPPRESSEEESVFRYHDAASSRAGISAVTGKLKMGKVAIVGLGGTGSYILDLVAKTPVDEIHLYDDDVLLAHNAFRSPGAAGLDDIKDEPFKVDYLFARYDRFRRNIFPHSVRITVSNVEDLRDMAFVFVAIDAGPQKRIVIENLEAWNVPLVDCGVGLQRSDNSLRGTLRVTAGREGHYAHIPRRISYTDVNADEYDWNIQTADLNMMNAAMAVIKWKKLFGYYVDSKREFNSTYTVASNFLSSGEVPE